MTGPRAGGRRRHTCDLWVQENENLRGRIHQLELSLQQRSDQLSHLERRSEQSEWRRGEELRKREDRVKELQLELDREKGKEPAVKVQVLSGSKIARCLFVDPDALVGPVRHPDGGGGVPRHPEAPE